MTGATISACGERNVRRFQSGLTANSFETSSGTVALFVTRPLPWDRKDNVSAPSSGRMVQNWYFAAAIRSRIRRAQTRAFLPEGVPLGRTAVSSLSVVGFGTRRSNTIQLGPDRARFLRRLVHLFFRPSSRIMYNTPIASESSSSQEI